jgi:hypothetical protein
VAKGQNIITRNSNESALTIPFEATFRNVDENRPDEGDFQSFDEFNYCGCGWPQHMLVPKGTKQGYPMDMFAMISNYELDRVIFYTFKLLPKIYYSTNKLSASDLLIKD